MAKRLATGKRRRRVASEATNLECTAGDESLAASKVPTLDSRVDLHVISFRVRLADPDGISAKAAIDGCVHRGLLRDDSAKHIREIRHQQIKVKNQEDEKTLLIFPPIEQTK